MKKATILNKYWKNLIKKQRSEVVCNILEEVEVVLKEGEDH
jgi:hypothetical protein